VIGFSQKKKKKKKKKKKGNYEECNRKIGDKQGEEESVKRRKKREYGRELQGLYLKSNCGKISRPN
jgi:hypothetical protein